MLTTPPLSLYIHLPWCIRKCPYCDFNSHALRTELPEQDYITALLADLTADLARIEIGKKEIISIFIGGGTPSLFSARAFEQLLTVLSECLTFAADIEITLEANPGTVEYQCFADYRAVGINRLSIGIQSFQADKLKALGRIHDDQEAVRAAEVAHAAGFTNFNLDLMHGLPQQSVMDALYDLTTAIKLAPTHISWYQLTLEPNTLFASKPPVLPDEEIIDEIQAQGRALLSAHGFAQYEISAYSQTDKKCRHNINYWRFGDYLGVGAGAHSKVTLNNTIKRAWKVKNPKDYLNPNLSFIGEEKVIAQKELPFEFMLNALRLYEDIPIILFEQRTGLPIKIIEKQLNNAQAKDLLVWDQESIRPTELGRRFYNDLVEMFIAS